MDVHIKSQSLQQYGVAAVSIVGEKILVNGQPVGVTIEHYNEAVDTIDEYYEMLVNAELIVPELTPEQQIENLSAQLSQVSTQLAEATQLNQRFASILQKFEQAGDSHEEDAPLYAETDATVNNSDRKGRNSKSRRVSSASDGADVGEGSAGKQ